MIYPMCLLDINRHIGYKWKRKSLPYDRSCASQTKMDPFIITSYISHQPWQPQAQLRYIGYQHQYKEDSQEIP